MPKPLRILLLGTLVVLAALLITAGLPASPVTTLATNTPFAIPDAAEAEAQRLDRLRMLYARLLALPQRTAFQNHMLEQIQTNNRFPPHNRLFSGADGDPVLAAVASDTRQINSADGLTRLTLRCDKRHYLPGETVTVQAFLTDQSSQRNLPAQLQAQLIVNERRPLATLRFTDADNNHIYTAAIATHGKPALQQGLYQIRVTAMQGNTGSIAFSLGDPLARLTGRYRDHLDNGHLIVEAEVQSESRGLFLLRATLYGEGNSRGLFAQQHAELQPGMQWVPLSFHGYLFQQLAQDGPYHLQHAALQRISFPASTGTLSQPGYSTAPY
ncbi:MAG TPA: hypothetical protein VM553_09660, partial [Dongiaceae bacterium]|nr:hypothetical protein [Dongiaceae bacterium]